MRDGAQSYFRYWGKARATGRVPRARGDEPEIESPFTTPPVCSPRPRG